MPRNTASNGFQPETEYVTVAGGEQLSELGADGNGNMIPQRTYVYQGGALMATYDLLDTTAANKFRAHLHRSLRILPKGKGIRARSDSSRKKSQERYEVSGRDFSRAKPAA